MVVGTAVSPLKKCLICTTTITVPHFGIDACRACASFFKRAKLAGKRFVCRQGDMNCIIGKDERFVCRSCRFDRCVNAGMVYDKTPKGNKKIGKDVKERRSPSSSCSDLDPIVPSTSKDPQESILTRIGRLFDASVDRRRSRELQLLQDRVDCEIVPHPTQKLFLSNFKIAVRLFEITMAETRQFYEKAFPAITKLSGAEQDLLCKSYIPKFCLIDNAYRTRKVWGEIKRFSMGSVVSLVDTERADLWLGELHEGRNKQALIDCLHDQYRVQCELVVPQWLRAHITTKEFYAILALVFCEINTSIDISEQAQSLIDSISALVLEDLQRYYKEEMGLGDFSTRLGHLLSLNHTIQECCSTCVEFVRLQQTVFDLFTNEDKIKELFF